MDYSLFLVVESMKGGGGGYRASRMSVNEVVEKDGRSGQGYRNTVHSTKSAELYHIGIIDYL